MNDKGVHIYEGNVQDLFLEGSNILTQAVEHTLGPNGTNSAVPTSNDFLSIINDGKSIIHRLSSDRPELKLVLNTLKESALATDKNSADGTTSSIVLQNQLLTNLLDYNRTHSDVITSSMLLNMRDSILKSLQKYKKEVSSDEDLRNVITVSLGSNTFTDVIFDAFKNLSIEQKPTIMKTDEISGVSAVSVEGISITPVEINPIVLKYMPLNLEEPMNVILINQSVSRLDTAFAAFLNKISKSPKKTVMFFSDISYSVLDQIHYNIQEGSLNLIPVKIKAVDKLDSYFGALKDYFKCDVLDEMNPYQLNYDSASIWGEATSCTYTKDSIVIHCDNDEYSSDILPSSSSIIKVGFTTYSQQDEYYKRIEDAVSSAYNARNTGYVLGAGFTYDCLGKEVDCEPVKVSMSYLFNLLFGLSNMNLRAEFVDYIEKNVFDSYMVAEQVIFNSFTVVSQVLSTKCLLVSY